MITFDDGSVRFSYRVAGIALHEGYVFMQRGGWDDIFFLPGGRAELLETATTSLKREMCEELDVEVTVERLLWIGENFFWHRHRAFHELGLYFLMQLPPDPHLYVKDSDIIGWEKRRKILFRWLPLASLADAPLYPAFLRQELLNLPQMIKHIVHTDGFLEPELIQH